MRTTPAVARAVNRGEVTLIHAPARDTYRRTTSRTIRTGGTKIQRPRTYAPGGLLVLHGGTRTPPREPGGRSGFQIQETVRARITNARRAPLGHPTPDQAQAAGYATPRDFELAWIRRVDRDWHARQIRQLVEAGTTEPDAVETTDIMAVIRYRDHHAQRVVWHLEIEVVHDLDRHLLPAARPKGSDTGAAVTPHDPLDAGPVQPVEQLDQRWQRRASRRHLDALEAEPPDRRAARIRQVTHRLRALARQDPKLLARLEELIRESDERKDAA